MDEQRLAVLGQFLTILAMVLLIFSRWGKTEGDIHRTFGIDSVILIAVVTIIMSGSGIVYTLRKDD
ncbi:hypothetical protein DMJ13_19825 [halophilic archaeon]|nr:hypothetical protein DMJ13_19825 [halophilic archaeon]